MAHPEHNPDPGKRTTTFSLSMATEEAIDPRLERARQLLDAGEHGLESLGRHVGLSAGHLHRSFRAAYGLSPAEYRAQVKLGELKRGLRSKGDVTRALVDAGYGSPSRVYEDGAARPKAKQTFEEGVNVRVIDGPFLNFSGVVEEVMPQKQKVRVLVSIFGRATPVELDFMQVERI